MIARFDIVPDGYFQAQAEQVGTTDDEIVAAAQDALPADRINAIAARLHFAAAALHRTETLGTC